VVCDGCTGGARLARLLGGNKRRMTVIGPADRMKTLCREQDLITATIT
jgi:hypothetical protein